MCSDEGSYVSLKFGTLKSWDVKTDKGRDLLAKWAALGYAMSTFDQKDTPEQVDLMCALIDEVDAIWLDWDGVAPTKEDAKKYLREYPRPWWPDTARNPPRTSPG